MLVVVLIWGFVLPAVAVAAGVLLSRVLKVRVPGEIDLEAGADTGRRSPALRRRSRRGGCPAITAGSAGNRPAGRHTRR